MRNAFMLAIAFAVIGVGARDELRSAANIAVPSALAQEPGGPQGCSLIGTFATKPDLVVSEDSGTPPWMSTGAGTESSGTIVTDVFHWPNITLAFPPPIGTVAGSAVRMSTMRGVWQRTGGNTLAFTQIGWALDANGDAVYVVRNSGVTTLSNGCNSEKVESTLEFWFPADFPDPAKAFFKEKIGDMLADRVMLTPSPTIEQ